MKSRLRHDVERGLCERCYATVFFPEHGESTATPPVAADAAVRTRHQSSVA